MTLLGPFREGELPCYWIMYMTHEAEEHIGDETNMVHKPAEKENDEQGGLLFSLQTIQTRY